jgi:ubiquinone/menaquinone biosynthesis C-methylase UbiE
MERVPEPELMNEEEQARAYACADFEEPHSRFIQLFIEEFPGPFAGCALDLGCGPGDITLRFAKAFPQCTVHGVDGAEAMLAHGRQACAHRGLDGRVRFIHGYLPGASLPRERYDAIISNSLLHHLAEPQVLWDSIKRYAAPGAPVLVMDLMRPSTRAEAESLVETYAAGEPEVLRRDFLHSLLAAYLLNEVRAQLEQADLSHWPVRTVSDRHLLVTGRS